MRTPRTVRIYGVTYKVKVVSTEEIETTTGGEALGFADRDKKEILLAEGQEPHVLEDTFVHECWHARLAESGVEDLIASHFDEDTAYRVIEAIVRNLTTAELREKKRK